MGGEDDAQGQKLPWAGTGLLEALHLHCCRRCKPPAFGSNKVFASVRNKQKITDKKTREIKKWGEIISLDCFFCVGQMKKNLQKMEEYTKSRIIFRTQNIQ